MTGQELVTSGGTEIDAMNREDLREFVTFHIAGQLFGIPVLIVQDILLPENIASIPLAPPEVRGSINLRGRIVTVIDVRVRLGLETREIATVTSIEDQTDEDSAANDSEATEATEASDVELTEEEQSDKAAKAAEAAQRSAHEAVDAVKRKNREHMMGVTVEHQNELYTLLVDSVGDVISLSKQNYEGNPSTLDPLWREFSGGVYRLDTDLMVVLDVERLLDFKGSD